MTNQNKLISGILLSAFIIVAIPAISQAQNNNRPMPKNTPNGTSTRMMASSSPMNKKPQNKFYNTAGVVKTVSTSSFTVDAFARNNATTTCTVSVNASTTYRYGTTTSSLSSITPGKHVMVIGEISTSTNIITAKMVNIMNPDLRNKDIRVKPGSPGNENGMFHKMLNWFRNKFR